MRINIVALAIFFLCSCSDPVTVSQHEKAEVKADPIYELTEEDKMLVQKMGIDLLMTAENYTHENFEEHQRTVLENAAEKHKNVFLDHLPTRVQEINKYEAKNKFVPDMSTVNLTTQQFANVYFINLIVEGDMTSSSNTRTEKTERVEMVAKMVLNKAGGTNTIEHRGWTSKHISAAQHDG